MGSIVGITGTPGTGKKSVAPLVAKALGLSCFGVPAVAENRARKSSGREMEIDTVEARRELWRSRPTSSVAYGHLLPYILPSRLAARVVVLRCDPRVLKSRLLRRGYSNAKVTENVEAELIGAVAYDAYAAFGGRKTEEFDTTRCSPTLAASAIVSRLERGGSRPERVDWTLSYGSAQALRSLFYPE